MKKNMRMLFFSAPVYYGSIVDRERHKKFIIEFFFGNPNFKKFR